jgi:hypothetical protein
VLLRKEAYMRLHQALELIEDQKFGGLKHWPPGEAASIGGEVLRLGKDAAEFRLISEIDGNEDLNTFQQFGRDLWLAGLARAPFSTFWLSWSQWTQGRDHPLTSMGAMCVQLPAANEGGQDGIGFYAMFFAPRSLTGFRSDKLICSSRLTSVWLGDPNIRVAAADNTHVGKGSITSTYWAVAALIGALGTPKAKRSVEPAPEKLNRQRQHTGRPAIRSQIVIDLRPAQNVSPSDKSRHGGWTVRPHWRRGHIRSLADGRLVPIPPCCVNMEDGIPVKPEYMIRSG